MTHSEPDSQAVPCLCPHPCTCRLRGIFHIPVHYHVMGMVWSVHVWLEAWNLIHHPTNEKRKCCSSRTYLLSFLLTGKLDVCFMVIRWSSEDIIFTSLSKDFIGWVAKYNGSYTFVIWKLYINSMHKLAWCTDQIVYTKLSYSLLTQIKVAEYWSHTHNYCIYSKFTYAHYNFHLKQLWLEVSYLPCFAAVAHTATVSCTVWTSDHAHLSIP